jgi:hypothetical protein
VSFMRHLAYCVIPCDRIMMTVVKREYIYDDIRRASVCCSNGVRESRSNNKLVDVGHPLSNMGIHYTLVLIYFYI